VIVVRPNRLDKKLLYLVRNDPVAAMAGVIEGLSGMEKLLDNPFGSAGRLVVNNHSHLSRIL